MLGRRSLAADWRPAIANRTRHGFLLSLFTPPLISSVTGDLHTPFAPRSRLVSPG